MYGVRLVDKVTNSMIRERCAMEEDVATNIRKGMLRWYGHLEIINEESASVNGEVGTGRPNRTFLGQIQEVLEKG